MRSCLLSALIICNVSVYAQKACVSSEYRDQQLRRNPELVNKARQLETFISHQLNAGEIKSTTGSSPSGGLPLIRIPVVVHILYNKQEENIRDEQILSQITALNQDFRKAKDIRHISETFQAIAADTYIEFQLAKIDPQGYATSGITRKQTNIRMFGMDDRIKFSHIGGRDAWDTDRYLNIWVGNTAGAIIGYSSVAGSEKNREGIVIRYDAFGTTGKVSAPYNKGKTAVHEIGHWLGLHHIWGDKYCGDDKVEDTPPQQAPSRGCPSGTVSSMCSNDPAGKMYMNFMDLTDDACLSIFTIGQRDRMRSLFAPGGPRSSLLYSDALTAIPKERIPGNDEASLQTHSIYPNPSTRMVTIKTDQSSIGKEIRFFETGGKPVSTIHITAASMKVDVSMLAKGLYFVRVGDNKGLLKFVKN